MLALHVWQRSNWYKVRNHSKRIPLKQNQRTNWYNMCKTHQCVYILYQLLSCGSWCYTKLTDVEAISPTQRWIIQTKLTVLLLIRTFTNIKQLSSLRTTYSIYYCSSMKAFVKMIAQLLQLFADYLFLLKLHIVHIVP